MFAYDSHAPHPSHEELIWIRPAGSETASQPLVDGKTLLMQAAVKGDAAAIRALVEGGAPVNAKDASGWTALFWAIKHRQVKAAAELITSGADVRVEARNGWTALSLAVKSGSPLLIELIAKIGGAAG